MCVLALMLIEIPARAQLLRITPVAFQEKKQKC